MTAIFMARDVSLSVAKAEVLPFAALRVTQEGRRIGVPDVKMAASISGDQP
jgi:hypothetical protein